MSAPIKKVWEGYFRHNDLEIAGFFGPYFWLSNFYLCRCEYEAYLQCPYPSSENAYQAAKVKLMDRYEFEHCSPRESKELWKRCSLVDASPAEWDARKDEVMREVLLSKFTLNQELRTKLLETGDKQLIELNNWGDTYWGVDIRNGGLNKLGQILMKTREYLRPI